jgi:hypothetical protein
MNMPKKRMLSKLAQAIRRRKVHFWGTEYRIVPRLVDWIHGDGLKVISLTPLATRPWYYVARVDSRLELDNRSYEEGVELFCGDALNQLLESIEDEFYQAEDEWTHDNGRTYMRHNDWPALNDSCGCSWGEEFTLVTPDRRTEREVRLEISQAAARKHRPSNPL